MAVAFKFRGAFWEEQGNHLRRLIATRSGGLLAVVLEEGVVACARWVYLLSEWQETSKKGVKVVSGRYE